MNKFNVYTLKLIYVFSIPDRAHEGCLKIGETTCGETDFSKLGPNSSALNAAARHRIDQYTHTAAINYELRYTELCLYSRGGKVGTFDDKEVHSILLRSGIQRKQFDFQNGANEWFITDLDTVKNAIKAAKEGRNSLAPGEVTVRPEETLQLRPEQRDAIEQTKKCFKTKKSMLWNAKMRFGKTVSALQLIKEMEFGRTIILTHRPVVNGGWYEDFRKIFADRSDFEYGSRDMAETLDTLLKANKEGKKIIYFCSMQDLRGSEQVGGKFDKNHEVFSTNWDLIVVDEAHEGTLTELGQAVIKELHKDGSKLLSLTGTAFNLLDHYEEDNVYTWDYTMEQRAKAEWDIIHQGDPNPYACLPKMNIWTYDLGKLLPRFIDEDVAFNFREFFRTGSDGAFVHADDVKSFLDMLTTDSQDSLYPFSNKTYRDIFNHTLWVLPGVREARALSAMLKSHNTFQYFDVVNVAGRGDDDEENEEALEMVRKAIGKEPEKTHTITLTCGRLTTGVSVPEWTAVFMLAGSHSTSASSYMQTIFRVQTPATIGGRMKTECYVFDFAPDRTLKVLAETAKVSAAAGKTSEGDRAQMGQFLNFCPVIGISGSTMKPYDTGALLEQLKRVYVERVVRNGFEDSRLYNDKLLKLNEMELKDFDGLKKIIGTTKAMAATKDIDINSQGLTEEEYAEAERLREKKRKKQENFTLEDEHRLEELKAKRKNRDRAISILRGISVRMPLMIYGADISDEDEQITIDNFTSLIDDQSWAEFMPPGVTKDIFERFKCYYDQDIFTAAGKRIRSLARAADNVGTEERIERITEIFATFRNPDKETVLTPWRVVNMHIGDTLGGWVFYNESYDATLTKPRFQGQEGITQKVFTPTSRILEINSKTGLYPLYVTYSIYRARLALSPHPAETIEDQRKLWDETVRENMFVICKTPMAKSITRRTLVGFRKARVNARYFEDLIGQIKNKPQNFIAKIPRGKTYWKANNDDNMKFNAIVGNPPYQVTTVGTSDAPVYHLFMDVAFNLAPLVTLITPARFLFNAGKTSKNFNERVLNDEHFKVVWYKPKSTDVFPNVDIKGGVCVTLRNESASYGKIISFTHYEELNGILKKTLEHEGFVTIMGSIILQNKFNLEILYQDHPEYKAIIGSEGRERRLTTPIFSQLDVFSEEERDGDICVLGLTGNNERTYRYIPRKYVEDNGNLAKYKIIVPASNGTGAIGEILSTPLIGEPLIGEPLIGYTQSFIGFGAFDTQQEAEAALKYVKSRFMRTLLGVLKITQHNHSDVWRFVPLQDFSPASDIDWSGSVAEVDRQLYAKYGLTEEEIAFIEKMIKPME